MLSIPQANEQNSPSFELVTLEFAYDLRVVFNFLVSGVLFMCCPFGYLNNKQGKV